MMSLCCLLAFAQGKSVTGTVTDPTGEPLIGVSVQVKGAKQGAITDFDGNFKLNRYTYRKYARLFLHWIRD